MLTQDKAPAPITVDLARLPMLLTTLHLPTIGQLWADFAERSDREGWPAARYLATLLEHELAERYQRRIQRHSQDAHLPAGKSFATFDFASVPMINKSQITALAAGGSWLDKGANLLAFGPPVSDSYCSSLDLLKTPALFDADCQTTDAEADGPALPG
jgi:DNA replication protein DnaC